MSAHQVITLYPNQLVIAIVSDIILRNYLQRFTKIMKNRMNNEECRKLLVQTQLHCLNALFVAPELLDFGEVILRYMSAEGHYFLMYCIDYPVCLREEELFKLKCGCDPVS